MMKLKRGFTLIELLVVIAIIAILAAILFPVFAAVKEKGRQVTCLNNMGQLAKGMSMYLNNSGGMYPGWGGDKTVRNNDDWVYVTIANRVINVTKGSLFPYVRNANLYKCPSHVETTAMRKNIGLSYTINGYLTHDMPGGLNYYATSPAYDAYLSSFLRATEAQVKYSSKTVLFIDEGKGSIANGALKSINDGFFDPKNDKPSIAHTDGGNFAFCDGHTRWVKAGKYSELIYRPNGVPETLSSH